MILVFKNGFSIEASLDTTLFLLPWLKILLSRGIDDSAGSNRGVGIFVLSDRQSQKSIIPGMDLKLHQFWRGPGMGKTRGGQRQSPAMAGKQPVRTGSQWEFHLNLLIRISVSDFHGSCDGRG